MRSNQKVKENKPALKSNFLSKANWADPDFEVENLTEPYCAAFKWNPFTAACEAHRRRPPRLCAAAARRA